MAITPTFPGVYVQEVPSGVRTITGVATSVAAFIDYFPKGPMNKAVRVQNQGDVNREFGGLDTLSEASYGLQQFFLNGGAEAWVVRVASADGQDRGPVAARALIGSAIPSQPPADEEAARKAATLVVSAVQEGSWGDNLAVRVEPSGSRFTLVVTEYAVAATRTGPARQETFRDLSMDAGDRRFADRVVNDDVSGSKLIRVEADRNGSPPLVNGTVSGEITGPPTIGQGAAVHVTIGGSGRVAALTFPPGTELTEPQPLPLVARVLQAAIRAARPEDPAFADTTVELIGQDGNATRGRLRVLAGPGSDPAARVTVSAVAGGDNTATDLRLVAGATQVRCLRSGQHTTAPDVPADPAVQVTVGTAPGTTVSLTLPAGPQQLTAIATALESALAANPESAGTVVQAVDDHLLVIPDPTAEPVGFADVDTTNTTATVLKLTSASGAGELRGLLSGQHANPPVLPANPRVSVTIDTATATASLAFPPGTSAPGPQPLTAVAPVLQAAIRTGPGTPFTGATVRVVGESLLVLPGGAGQSTVSFANADDPLADVLLLTTGATANLQEYRLGGGRVDRTAQLGGGAGRNGVPPDGTALIGDLASKTGIFALEDADLFNLLCLPRVAMVDVDGGLDQTEAGAVLAVAQSYCEKRRAFLLIDTPAGIDELPEILGRLPKVQRHRNSALFYPRVRIPDPLDDFRLRSVGASGSLAGLFARIDGARGVWKAPAGTEAGLRNVVELDHLLTDAENGVLNPLGVNCLRVFPIFGPVSWGARTLEGADQQASEWKYIPVRRLALFIEETLFRGTTFAVFEPNDEPLWAQLRLNVGAFMSNLYRKGAFQGSSPNEAFLVKVDAETTTQDDIDAGIVNILVGFRPLKPAEFVFLNIQQLAGQVQA